MSRLFVGNFAWEETLSGNRQLPAAVARMEMERAGTWLGVCAAGDEILLPAAFDGDFWIRMRDLGLPEARVISFEDLANSSVETLVPWGWTEQLVELAASQFPDTRIPSLESIRHANSRVFQLQVCRELGCDLAGEEILHSAEELSVHLEAAAARSASEGWLLKANLSFAGRGQRRLAGAILTSEDARWVAGAISRTGAVALEPILNAVRELSGQWEITSGGAIQFLGFTQLFSDHRGGYLGTATWLDEVAGQFCDELLASQRPVVEILQHSGYFGPVGIDAMLHLANNQLSLRPVQDINARWTMGRLALGWRDHFARLGMGAHGTWRHGKTCDIPGAICLAPDEVGGVPVSTRNWWIPRTCGVEETSSKN